MPPPRPLPPVVHLGPTLSAAEATALLPGCEIRPPVARGDLYREREQGRSVFLMLDGVFMSKLAVAPREVLDVLADGAFVVGASSMGALRASECWPAGMHGVGAIYRLYRRGALDSDDEVAVTFDPADRRALSLALINVRWAVRRAARSGDLALAEGAAIVEAARSLFYADRTWDAILARAGLSAEKRRIVAALTPHDLKRDDARRALAWLHRALARDPEIHHRPRRRTTDFDSSDRSRERAHDATGGEDIASLRRALSEWLLVSGRHARYLPALAAADPDLADRLRRASLPAHLMLRSANLGEAWAAASGLRPPAWAAAPGLRPPAWAAASGLRPPACAALRFVWHQLWTEGLASPESFADRIWPELVWSGELDAELFRFRAIREAARRAREAALTPDRKARLEARTRIAHAHGFDAWSDLERAARGIPGAWQRIAAYSEELALARTAARLPGS